MENTAEEVLDSYYEDAVELKDNKLLIFKRVVDYRRTDRTAAIVYLEDQTLGTTIELGTYIDAEWKFITPITENLFWSTVKSYQKESQEVFTRIRSRVPSSKDLHMYKVNFQRLSEKANETITRLKSIFYGEVQDNNN